MLQTFKILATRKLDQFHLPNAAAKHIILVEEDFITTEPLINEVVEKEIQKVVSKKINVIFTSINAVNAVAEQINQAPQWEVFTISDKTKKAVIQQFPKSKIIASASYGKDLVEKILSRKDISDLVFFSGNKRMDTIPERLKSAGISLHEIIVYTTILSPKRIDDDYDGILFFSPSAVESFFSINKIPKQTILFSIGNTTTHALKAYSENKIITSDFQSVEQVINLANDYGFLNDLN